jgi:hypothetical protein
MTRRAASLVIASALAVKLVLLAVVFARNPNAFSYNDSREYLGAARALVQLGVYAPDVTRSSEPEVLRTPGYPVLAAVSLALFGDRTWPLSVLGAIASALTALVVLVRFTPPVPERAAAWAAAILSLDPGSLIRSLDILSETFFTLLLVVFLAQFIRLLRSGSFRHAFLAGLTLAVATLVRPIGQYLGPIAVVGLAAVLATAGVPRRRVAAACALFAAPILVLVGGWIVRNRLVAGFTGLAPVAGHQLLHRRAAAVVAAAEGITLTQAQERLGIREAFYRFRGPSAERDLFGGRRYVDVFPETCRESLVSLDRKWERETWEIFRAHPVLTARMLAKGAAMLLFSPPPIATLARFEVYTPDPELIRLWEDQELVPLASRFARWHPVVFAAAAVSILWLAFLWGTAAVGLAAAPRVVGLAPAVLLGGTLAYFIVLSASTDALDDRYRVPLVPAAGLLAGIALGARSPALRRPAGANVATMSPVRRT